MEKKPQIPNAFMVILSGGMEPLQVDADELGQVVQAIKTKQPAVVRQGLFNPSYYIAVVQDTKRISKIREEINQVLKHNEHDAAYNEGRNQYPYPTLTPLKNIFENTEIGRLMEARRLKELAEGTK